MLSGSLVAIVTPMLEDGSLDLARFRSLIDWHVAEGTQGIVVVGTTGESPTVDFAIVFSAPAGFEGSSTCNSAFPAWSA